MAPLLYSALFYCLLYHSLAFSGIKIGQDPPQKHEDANKQQPMVKCKISTQNPRWKLSSVPPVVSIEIELQGRAEVRVLPSLSVLALRSGPGRRRDEYWAPFSLDDSKTTSEWSTLANAHGKRTLSLRVSPFDLLWARTISSVWPSEKFVGTVLPGEYRLRLQVETADDKYALSNEIKISIQR